MRIPNTIRTDNMELRQAWEKLARIINYELPDQLVTLPISESDVTNLVENLAKKQDKTDSGGDSGGGGSSITLPINESDVRNLVNDLAKCEKSDNKDKSYGYPRLTGDGIVPDNELPVQAQTIAPVAHKWLNGFDRPTGTFTQTQPAAFDLSDGVIGSGSVLLDTAALPKPWRKRFVLWTPAASAPTRFYTTGDVESLNLTGGSFGDAAALPTATENSAYHMITNNFNNGSGGLYGNKQIYTGRVCSFETKVRLLTGLLNYRCWLCLTDEISQYTYDTSVAHANVIGFRYYSDLSPNWICCVGTSAAMTSIDSNVAADITTPRKMNIELNGSKADFYIDNVLVASTAVNYPAAVSLAPYLGLQGYGGAPPNPGACGMSFQYVYAECATP